jgi:hypothetical protein
MRNPTIDELENIDVLQGTMEGLKARAPIEFRRALRVTGVSRLEHNYANLAFADNRYIIKHGQDKDAEGNLVPIQDVLVNPETDEPYLVRKDQYNRYMATLDLLELATDAFNEAILDLQEACGVEKASIKLDTETGIWRNRQGLPAIEEMSDE